MAIPSEILAIERPKNTVVKATRTPGVYSVVKRTSKRVPEKKNPQPVEICIFRRASAPRPLILCTIPQRPCIDSAQIVHEDRAIEH